MLKVAYTIPEWWLFLSIFSKYNVDYNMLWAKCWVHVFKLWVLKVTKCHRIIIIYLRLSAGTGFSAIHLISKLLSQYCCFDLAVFHSDYMHCSSICSNYTCHINRLGTENYQNFALCVLYLFCQWNNFGSEHHIKGEHPLKETYCCTTVFYPWASVVLQLFSRVISSSDFDIEHLIYTGANRS